MAALEDQVDPHPEFWAWSGSRDKEHRSHTTHAYSDSVKLEKSLNKMPGEVNHQGESSGGGFSSSVIKLKELIALLVEAVNHLNKNIHLKHIGKTLKSLNGHTAGTGPSCGHFSVTRVPGPCSARYPYIAP